MSAIDSGKDGILQLLEKLHESHRRIFITRYSKAELEEIVVALLKKEDATSYCKLSTCRTRTKTDTE
jgi:hypothetical protein